MVEGVYNEIFASSSTSRKIVTPWVLWYIRALLIYIFISSIFIYLYLLFCHTHTHTLVFYPLFSFSPSLRTIPPFCFVYFTDLSRLLPSFSFVLYIFPIFLGSSLRSPYFRKSPYTIHNPYPTSEVNKEKETGLPSLLSY